MTTMTTLRTPVDADLLARIDAHRGDTPRTAWVREVLNDVTTLPDVSPGTVDQVLEAAVERAARAYQQGRPGYGELILTKVAMVAEGMEDLARDDVPELAVS